MLKLEVEIMLQKKKFRRKNILSKKENRKERGFVKKKKPQKY